MEDQHPSEFNLKLFQVNLKSLSYAVKDLIWNKHKTANEFLPTEEPFS